MGDWRQAVDAIADRWHTKTGLIAGFILVNVVLISFFARVDIADVQAVEWLAMALASLVLGILWWRTTLPRVPRNRVGFGVALDCENSEHAKRLRSDFVLALQELVINSPGQLFDFIELRPSVARRILTPGEADRIAKRCNLRFLLYGRARLRSLPQDTTQSHFIDLHGWVRHAPIERQRSVALGGDFRAALPSRLIVNPDGDVFSFEFAARHIDSISRYVMGTAAALSNDFDSAERLLLDAEARLVHLVGRAEGGPLLLLRDRVRRRLADLYRAWFLRSMLAYRTSRLRAELQQTEELLVKLRRFAEDDYVVHLAAAIAAFVLHRDVDTATREIRKCSHSADATWRYSEAFLLAYEGDLQGAYRSYSRAFDSPLNDPTVPNQSEEFIQMVLDEEPERTWLYYCLGLINHRAKGDLEAARNDFRLFLASADPNRFAFHITVATRWIEEIDAALREAR